LPPVPHAVGALPLAFNESDTDMDIQNQTWGRMDFPPSAKKETRSGFETEADALAEDQLRATSIRRALPPLANKVRSRKRVAWLLRNTHAGLPSPPVKRRDAKDLAAKLKAGSETGFPPPSLASSAHMRLIRRRVLGALLSAVEDYQDDELATFTIIDSSLRYSPEELDAISAETIKNRWITHLKRFGISNQTGFLLAFLHGEFEPTSRTYQVHFHGVGTKEKVEALRRLLGHLGYTTTSTGAPCLRIDGVKDRVPQLSYLLKSYWPEKAVRLVNGKPKRDRKAQRVKEPFQTQYLLWLDRQQLSALTIFNGGWSRRNGGPETMRQLYLSIYSR